MLKLVSQKVNHICHFIANSENVQLLSHMLLARACIVCEKENHQAVCFRCVGRLEGLKINPETSCPVCAMPSQSGLTCGQCMLSPPPFDATMACFYYAEPMDQIILRYKYNKKLWMVKWFSDCLLETIDQQRLPDLIIPVPLHDLRIKQRGYNQAFEIVKRINRQLNVQIAYDILIKTVDQTPQQQLSRSKRLTNPVNTMTCTTDIAGKTVALVDDVMTTGATLSEAARVLKKAGAAKVMNWVIARTR